MGRKPCCDRQTVNKGAWTPLEDRILSDYISLHGHANWRSIAQNAGLNRCAKSCRLRWMNYLRPDIKRGPFSPEEDDLIIRLHRLLGSRWAMIARRIPGRTDNDIKNHWNSNLLRKLHPQVSWPCPRTPVLELEQTEQRNIRESLPSKYHNTATIAGSTSLNINHRSCSSSTSSGHQNPLNSSMDVDINEDLFSDLLLKMDNSNINDVIVTDNNISTNIDVFGNKSSLSQENEGMVMTNSCDVDTGNVNVHAQPTSTFLSELKRVARLLELEDHECEG